MKFQQEFDAEIFNLRNLQHQPNTCISVGDSRLEIIFIYNCNIFSPADKVEVPHSAGASGLPPASLHWPSVLPDMSCRVSTGSAGLLLNVETDLATPPAQGVGLIAPFSKGTGSLGHLGTLLFWNITMGLSIMVDNVVDGDTTSQAKVQQEMVEIT